ncbi:hypothetical protein [Rubellimicrobium roseum]|uniref:hypothetical protein n=1 Tax=Rubellimicrobium roseum TaxID=687525 RepID=UPI00159BC256|nr:hypothetical protein [Rubellimicrobium roseum]
MVLFFAVGTLLLVLMVSLIRWKAQLGGVAQAIELLEVTARRSLRGLTDTPLPEETPTFSNLHEGMPVQGSCKR